MASASSDVAANLQAAARGSKCKFQGNLSCQTPLTWRPRASLLKCNFGSGCYFHNCKIIGISLLRFALRNSYGKVGRPGADEPPENAIFSHFIFFGVGGAALIGDENDDV